MSDKSIVRSVAQWAVNAFVAAKVETKAADFIADRTNFEEGGIPVKIASGAIAMLVTGFSKPYTDKAVDFAADRIVEFTENQKAKKQPPLH